MDPDDDRASSRVRISGRHLDPSGRWGRGRDPHSRPALRSFVSNRPSFPMNPTPGKTIGPRTYLHIDAACALDAVWTDRWRAAERIAGLQRGAHYNLIRLDAEGPTLALLHYSEFFDEPFPTLRESWLVDLERQTVSYRTYADSLNPPILHRKELLLPDHHPRRAEYAALTEAAATIGLFDRPTRIGYQRQWRALVREKGYRIAGHALVPLGNDDTGERESGTPFLLVREGWGEGASLGWQAARQLTALARHHFSAPVQTLARSLATTPPPRPPRGACCSRSPTRTPSLEPAGTRRNAASAGWRKASRCDCTPVWSSSFRRCCGSTSAARLSSTATTGMPIW